MEDTINIKSSIRN